MRLALLGACAALWAAAPASAGPGLEVGLEDERIMLTEPAIAAQTAQEWADLGIDVVRLHARWGRLAPATKGDPYDWGELDRAIAALRGAGLPIMLTLTGPGPLWSSTDPKQGTGAWKPDPQAFAAFARDVAARYGPDVDRYLLWNEPNISGWLLPQYECRGKRCVLASPHIYRGLVQAAVPAIRLVDPTAEIVMGELAPIGRGRPRVTGRPTPLAFLRAMGCVNEKYRPLRTRACRGFKPVRAHSIGHHPHGVRRAPDTPNPDRNAAQMGDLARLFGVIDKLTARRRLVPLSGRRFPLHLTEFGYQTSPPDHYIGVTFAQQVRYLQQAAYIAWRHPRVRSLMHYQWIDEPVQYRGRGMAAYSGWQSGLITIDGKPKPALKAFVQPFVIDRAPGARTARFFGQVRPGGSHEVTLQRRARGSSAWVPVGVRRTDSRGYWSAVMRVDARSDYRFVWRRPQPSPYIAEDQYSGIVSPGAKVPRRIKAALAP